MENPVPQAVVATAGKPGLSFFGGGGGNRTPVRKWSAKAPTSLVRVKLLIVPPSSTNEIRWDYSGINLISGRPPMGPPSTSPLIDARTRPAGLAGANDGLFTRPLRQSNRLPLL